MCIKKLPGWDWGIRGFSRVSRIEFCLFPLIDLTNCFLLHSYIAGHPFTRDFQRDIRSHSISPCHGSFHSMPCIVAPSNCVQLVTPRKNTVPAVTLVVKRRSAKFQSREDRVLTKVFLFETSKAPPQTCSLPQPLCFFMKALG